MALWEDLFSLKGERVSLVPIDVQHIEGLWEAAKSPETWTYMATKLHAKEDLTHFIESSISNRNKGIGYTFVVFDQHDQIIGSTSYLDINGKNGSLEIGSTWYHPKAWRTRVNTECKLLLLQHAFENWNIRRVQLKTDSRNHRSQAAIVRIGGIKEGILRKDRIISDGYVRDTVFYSILQNEWGEVKKRLSEMLSK